jgi:Ser/Thr protein kinase RdoA (MazF antagonist)
VNEKQLLEILKTQYGVTGSSLKFLREGGGQTYLADGKEKYLFKVIGGAFLHTARQSVSIMRYLEENGFPVPRTIPTRDGAAALETAAEGGEKLIVLMEFIDGDEPDLKETAAEVGALVGRFHRLMETCPAEPVSRGKDFFIGRYLELLRKKSSPRLSDYAALGDRLWEKVKALPRGTCHGDLHRGNLLQSADGQIYLVDFDTVCRAPRMFDLAVMCDMTDYFRLRPEDVRLTGQVYQSFLSGYSSYHALSRSELLSFPAWVAIRHFQLQATILEIYGIDCIDEGFIDAQRNWLRAWEAETAGLTEPFAYTILQ